MTCDSGPKPPKVDLEIWERPVFGSVWGYRATAVLYPVEIISVGIRGRYNNKVNNKWLRRLGLGILSDELLELYV